MEINNAGPSSLSGQATRAYGSMGNGYDRLSNDSVKSNGTDLDLSMQPSLSQSGFERRRAARMTLEALFEQLGEIEAGGRARQLQLLSEIRRIVSTRGLEAHLRTDFAEAGGFLLLIQVLSSLVDGDPGNQDVANGTANELRLSILHEVLSILGDTIAFDATNHALFEKDIGWNGLHSTLMLSQIRSAAHERYYGSLFSLALRPVRMQDSLESAPQPAGLPFQDLDQMEKDLREQPMQSIVLPQAIELLYKHAREQGDLVLHQRIFKVLVALLQDDVSNRLALRTTSLSFDILSDLLRSDESSGDLAVTMAATLGSLYEVSGLPLKDGKILLNGIQSPKCLHRKLLVHLLKSFTGLDAVPNHVRLDTTVHGHASIAVSSLRRPFPPTGTSDGWSFFASVRIDRWGDANTPARLLHIFDAHRTCSVDMSIAPQTGHLSVLSNASETETVFSLYRFRPGQFYNIAVVHRRPRVGREDPPLADLFVDGLLVDQQPLAWPSQPSSPESPVRVVFGTAPNQPDGSTSKDRQCWSLGPAYLLDQCLPSSFPFILEKLGHAYAGNLQDSLGRFLTYQTSTAINLRLDTVAKDLAKKGYGESALESHPLVNAIAGKSSDVIAEDRLYFVFDAKCVTRGRPPRVQSGVAEHKRPGPIVLVNQAMTYTRDALGASSGYAKLYGSPSLVVPSRTQDVIWALGGCSIMMRVLEAAEDETEFSDVLQIFVRLLSSSHRLCEDAEQIGAYEILNRLLRSKPRLLTREILQILLQAVGVDLQGDDSALANPLLYRIVLLDFELWAQAAEEVQINHFGHFAVLLRTSTHKRFNIRRTAKMQLVRRMLYRFQQPAYPSEELSLQMLDALKVLLLTSWSEPSLKALMGYLAITLCDFDGSDNKGRRNATMDTRRRSVSWKNRPTTSVTSLSLRFFEALVELATDRPNYLAKLEHTISLKWLLLFLHPKCHPRASVAALDLIARLVTKRPSFADVMHTAGGWKVVARMAPRLWSQIETFPICLAAMLGIDRNPGRTLLEAFSPPQPILCTPMIQVMVACLRDASVQGLRSVLDPPQPNSSAGRNSGSAQTAENSPTRAIQTRRRGFSVTLDQQSLDLQVRQNSSLGIIRDVAILIRLYASSSVQFREALFTTAVLRSLLEALEPYICKLASENSPVQRTAVEKCFDDLLIMLTGLSTDDFLVSGSLSLIRGLMAAIPLRDLAQQALVRAVLLEKILEQVQIRLVAEQDQKPSPATIQSVVILIEQASHDTQYNPTLQNTICLASASMMEILDNTAETATEEDIKTFSNLHNSCNRMVLFGLSGDSSSLGTFRLIKKWKTLFLAQHNPDPTFHQCLVNQICTHLTAGDSKSSADCVELFDLMLASECVAPREAAEQGTAIVDWYGKRSSAYSERDLSSSPAEAPFEDIWLGVVKSIETLRSAMQLERITLLRRALDQSEAREKATTITQRRMEHLRQRMKASEDDRIRKHIIDVEDMQQTAQTKLHNIRLDLHRERAAFGEETPSERAWQLDSIEGPKRMRKRLQEQPKPVHPEELAAAKLEFMSPRPETLTIPEEDSVDDVEDEEIEDSLVEISLNDTPTAAEPATETNAAPLVNQGPEEEGDDLEHKVLRSLERGDRVEGVINASRVVGIDCRAALCITGKLCLYIIDDYFQRSNGELVNIWQAPESERDAFVQAALSSEDGRPSAFIEQIEGAGQTRKWPWSSLRRVHRRFFLQRGTALELFFLDGQSCLLVFPTLDAANAFYKDLGSRSAGAVSGSETMREGIRQRSGSVIVDNQAFRATLGAALGRQQAGQLTEVWRQRKITNYDYLISLNTLAGRSFNDLSQYPVFPWILADYTSNELDLEKPETFRRLDLPMGAQTKERRKQFEDRYTSLVEIEDTPFHYGTHFSTAATTAGYLIRTRPFDKLLMALQGGSFDLADRTFSSIERAWKSASELSRGDVRELTPEFFYLPEFLINSNKLDFGMTQAGTTINDVELPPWANGDPILFIQKHREALESEYVSANLHHWIDLIFGFKQGGEEAVKAVNVFHPLSYAGQVDLAAITDIQELRAISQTIWNFGVCASKLFDRPHLPRNAPDKDALELSTTPYMAIQNLAPLRTLKAACHFIYADAHEKVFASPADYLIVPKLGVSISAEHLDGSLRMYKSTDSSKPVAVVEQASIDRILCMAQTGPTTILVGCRDGLVIQWKIDVRKEELLLDRVLAGHTGAASCVTASQAWSVAVTGSNDGTAIIWDTIRGSYIRTLWEHDGLPVVNVAIDEQDGYIATATAQSIHLWTINGDKVTDLQTSSRARAEPISALAFLPITPNARSSGSGRLAILLTGHLGKVIAWTCEPVLGSGDGSAQTRWELQPFHVFEHSQRLFRSVESAHAAPSSITAIAVSASQTTQAGRLLLTGDSSGRLVAWTFPGEAISMPENLSTHCVTCGRKWGMLEVRRLCKGCGGLFCGACTETIAKGEGRFAGMKFCKEMCAERCVAIQ